MKTSTALPTEPQPLSYEEAAAALQCSRSVIERLVRVGELQVIKYGARCVRVDRTSFEAYLAKRRVKAQTA
jgi:excisionase family DNA binding protein